MRESIIISMVNSIKIESNKELNSIFEVIYRFKVVEMTLRLLLNNLPLIPYSWDMPSQILFYQNTIII